MKMLVYDEVPDGFLGPVDSTSTGDILVNYKFLKIVVDVAENVPTYTQHEPDYTCNGTCYT